jgi:putative endonuclease
VLGKTGEEFAVKFLSEKGYAIVDRNWRWGRHEIDIIARHGTTIVIIEVKTRKTEWDCEPESAVVPRKQKILVAAANAWVRYRKQPGEVRFDVITVIIGSAKHTINHITDAFYAY